MSNYLFAYRAPTEYSGGDPDVMTDWMTWFESLGDQLVERGNPVFTRSSVGRTGSETLLGGYSIVRADDLEAATLLAKGCPSVTNGGGVEVGEITELG